MSKRRKSLVELLEVYPEWVAYIKYFEGIATKDIMENNNAERKPK